MHICQMAKLKKKRTERRIKEGMSVGEDGWESVVQATRQTDRQTDRPLLREEEKCCTEIL